MINFVFNAIVIIHIICIEALISVTIHYLIYMVFMKADCGHMYVSAYYIGILSTCIIYLKV